jgi:hypothetical protein
LAVATIGFVVALSSRALNELVKPGMGFNIVKEVSKYDYDYWNGRVLIWDPPEMGASYCIGVDVAEGVGGDRSVIEVLRRGDLSRPDEQVAEFASDYHDPLDLSPIVAELGRFYRDDDGTAALAIVEANGLGEGVILDLNTRLEYDNLFRWKVYDKVTNLETNRLGWWTNRTSRPKLIARGVHAIIKSDLVMHSTFLFEEWTDFQRDHYLARAAATSGHHDDRVMAMLMAHWGAHDDEWVAGIDIAEQRRLLTAAGTVLQAKEEKVGRRADYQNRAITAAQMDQEADDALFGDFSW